ncbi:hypothetical protein MNQ98_10805 [Paenibacillus sp. N3/727]|uniref:hypothetical protein n=1 Tax=Paenibacillus sp. N3/727 TaxID=2925845 RepID=UPI001F52E60F|nr:hypothetical protein [Paenibacillus sp. N3/727]UNK20463.1 hypothetical protein MNQ98_10805 [Paenibacillus sp. N3/727]
MSYYISLMFAILTGGSFLTVGLIFLINPDSKWSRYLMRSEDYEEDDVHDLFKTKVHGTIALSIGIIFALVILSTFV